MDKAVLRRSRQVCLAHKRPARAGEATLLTLLDLVTSCKTRSCLSAHIPRARTAHSFARDARWLPCGRATRPTFTVCLCVAHRPSSRHVLSLVWFTLGCPHAPSKRPAVRVRGEILGDWYGERGRLASRPGLGAPRRQAAQLPHRLQLSSNARRLSDPLDRLWNGCGRKSKRIWPAGEG